MKLARIVALAISMTLIGLIPYVQHVARDVTARRVSAAANPVVLTHLEHFDTNDSDYKAVAEKAHQEAKDFANQTLHQNDYNQSFLPSADVYPLTAVDYQR